MCAECALTILGEFCVQHQILLLLETEEDVGIDINRHRDSGGGGFVGMSVTGEPSKVAGEFEAVF